MDRPPPSLPNLVQTLTLTHPPTRILYTQLLSYSTSTTPSPLVIGKSLSANLIVASPPRQRDDGVSLWDIAHEIFPKDDNERFVSTANLEIKEKGRLLIDRSSIEWPGIEIMYAVCVAGALNCAAAILNGETPIELDLNSPTNEGHYLLHSIVESAPAKSVEFLISRGARTDIRGFGHDSNVNAMLPLEILLEKTCSFVDMKSWNQDPYVYERTSMSICKQPKQQSVFMLVTMLCLPGMESRLSKLRVLAWSTKETEELFLQFVRCGEVVKVAALLGAAHKKLMSEDVLSDADKKAAIPPIQQLFEVFERAGDAIDEYRKQEKVGGAMEQTVDFVAKLLEQSGFVFDPEDVDITIYRWARIAIAREWTRGILDRFGKRHARERPRFLKLDEEIDEAGLMLDELRVKSPRQKKKTRPSGQIQNSRSRARARARASECWDHMTGRG